MSYFHKIVIGILLALLLSHLLVRYASAADDLVEIKAAVCSQGASIQVMQNPSPDEDDELLFLRYYEECMEKLKDLPYIHN